MANEITEPGQIVVYGGPALTLKGSAIGNKVTSILTREGSGNNRAWRIFDPTKSDFLNTKKVINSGDVLLINAKTLPMDFVILAAGNGSVSQPVSYAISEAESGPNYEIDAQIDCSANYLPSVSFSQGSGTLQMQINSSGNWVAAGMVAKGETANFRILNNAPFTATLTLTPQ